MNIEEINQLVRTFRQPIDAIRRMDMSAINARRDIGAAARCTAKLLNENWEMLTDAWNYGAVQNAATATYGTADAPGVLLSTDLQRQVILNEGMRAFRRRFVSMDVFAHTYSNVPLQGKDEIDVPYYPLFTAGSQRYVQSKGYQFSGNDQGLRKQISVGGAGPDQKLPGQDRAYQALTLSAYLLSRQPWVGVQKLVAMRAEQLALDVATDIITAWILKANFGNAVWSGLPGDFDETVVAMIAGACSKTDWPEGGRNLVIGTDYWVNLVSSPYVKAYANIGDTGIIRKGRIGGLYGFNDVVENPRIPTTADGNLIGWASYPSAILIATCPILPAPGELKLMSRWELATDPETNIALSFKEWGEPWNSADREILECCYGSGPGELAGLKRLVAQDI